MTTLKSSPRTPFETTAFASQLMRELGANPNANGDGGKFGVEKDAEGNITGVWLFGLKLQQAT
jgi:hypothetical protein